MCGPLRKMKNLPDFYNVLAFNEKNYSAYSQTVISGYLLNGRIRH
jgi:hypothetical protein